jgi:hypothetical protein
MLPLDIFNLRDSILNDYQEYINSFLNIRDERVREFVQQELNKGELLPDSSGATEPLLCPRRKPANPHPRTGFTPKLSGLL